MVIDYICNVLFMYQVLASLSACFLLHLAHILSARHRRNQLFRHYGVPGPKPSLLEGNYDILRRRPYTLEMDWQLRNKYGKVIGLMLGDMPTMYISDLDILKKVFIEDAAIFKDRSDIMFKNSGTESILFAKYKEWNLYRKIMSPPFSRYAIRGQDSTRFVEEIVKSISDYIDSRLEPNKSGKPAATIHIRRLMRSAMLKVIAIIAIKLPDVQVNESDKYVRDLDHFLGQIDTGLIDYTVWIPVLRSIIEFLAKVYEGRFLGKVKHVLEATIDGYGKQSTHASGDQQNHVIDTLVQLHHQGKISRLEVIDNALSLLFAGYDTSSTTLTYLFWVLAKHTDVQDKLRSDLIAHGTDSRYLEQVIYETLRRYPTLRTFLSRLAAENVQYDNVFIPKGTTVIYNAWLINLDPDIWPDPMEFDPGRFAPGKTHHPCAFAPFGFGGHRCIGSQLAMLEIKMILCELVIRYKIRLKGPSELEQCVSAHFLTKPMERVVVEFERLIN